MQRGGDRSAIKELEGRRGNIQSKMSCFLAKVVEVPLKEKRSLI